MDLTPFGFRLQVDAARTARYYAPEPTIAEAVHCGCLECHNYVAACATFPPAVTELFAALGLDPRKPAEIMWCCQNPDGTHLYQGFYLFCGAVEGQAETDWFHIRPFRFGITNATPDSYGVDRFPVPCAELAVAVNVPWVLSEPPA